MNIVLVLLDVRSAHNVGSIIRSAECFGVEKIICVGVTPYPMSENDTRLPHVALKTHNKIAKTALGAENNIVIEHAESIEQIIAQLKQQDYYVCALEQNPSSKKLGSWKPTAKTAIIVGNEPLGIPLEVIELTDACVEIEQFGAKESLNVSVAAGIALYEFTKA
jgi:tRNA G18 (ribose-2'-O)-methylase SpoU